MTTPSPEKATITFSGANGEDLTGELARFAGMLGLDRAAPGRYSALLVCHLYMGMKANAIDPWKVAHEIDALEGIGRSSQLKAPIRNRFPPLKGLWHKHYQQSGIRSLAMNIQKALKRYGLPYAQQKAKEAKESGELHYFSAEDIKAISIDVVHGNYVRLGQEAAVSGEWLVFAQHEGLNYYLCLATHEKSEHPQIRNQIDLICCKEFSFLSQLLATA
jgi:hypothetical protein